MDDITILHLSRYLDGDLDPTEVRVLEERLRDDPELIAELAALEALRGSLAAIAERDEPPAELDRMIEPLRRSVPPRPGVRPWLRWVGAAAAVVLGLTVVLEMNQRLPGPVLEDQVHRPSRARSMKPTERFALAPLPTSSIPPEERPLGAADQLLASPIPESAPELDEMPPLEVIGPLKREENDIRTTTGAASELSDQAAPEVSSDRDYLSGKAARADRPAPPPPPRSEIKDKKDAGPTGVESRGSLEQASAEEKEKGRLLWSEQASGGRAQLFILIDGETAWRTFEPQRRCTPGRFIVQVEIRAGSVHEARSVGGALSTSPSGSLCAAQLVIGVEIDGVPDGQYQAEVVVNSPRTK